jgi:antitoxin component of RelBE/YafQ-DinJ toxin-antitoxin module
MSDEKLTERLMPVRMDKPLCDELQRISEELGLTKSEVVRASLYLAIEKPSEVERIMSEWKKQTDEWYRDKEKVNKNVRKGRV